MSTIAIQLLVQVILILINAFFAATEIAVISLNANKMRMLEESGDKLAPRLLKCWSSQRPSSPPSRSASRWPVSSLRLCGGQLLRVSGPLDL